MRSSLKAGSVRDRVSRIVPAGSLAIALAVVLLALADGGYTGESLGSGSAVVWILVVVSVLARPEGLRGIPAPLAGAALLLGLLLGLTALSLGWGNDDGAGFADVVRLSGYLGVFVLAGLLARPGDGRPVLIAVAAAVLVVALIALGSRLLGIGSGDAVLADVLPPSQGRLSFPLGYWNALGALMALAVPILAHLASSGSRRQCGAALAALGPVLLTAYMTSSRGALLAALIGALVVVAFADERRRTGAALASGVALALPALIGASAAGGILDSPGDGSPGGAELGVLALLLAGCAAAAFIGPALTDAIARISMHSSRLPRIRPAIAIPVVAAVAIGLVLLTGPARLIDDFRSLSPEARTEASTGILSASGSGRAQFWGTALDAFADEPVRGIGAGGYATYWNQHGSLGTPTRNAHSEPLELLAELGPAGLLGFAGFAVIVALAGVRRARGPAGAAAGAALGVLAAGAVGFLIDWTWQVPAVTVPVLVVAAALAGRGFGPAAAAGLRVPAPLAGAALVAVAIPSLWAAGVLAVATSRLDESDRALAAGDPAGAARAARAAIAVEPWAAEPWFQLAEVERTVDNVEAAQLAAREGIERAPNDFRGWILASNLQSQEGASLQSTVYAARALALAPLLIPRVGEFAPTVTEPE